MMPLPKNPEDKRENLEAAREKEDDPDANEEEDVSRLITDDPTLMSPAEIEILQQLAVRRDNLDAREAEFSAREGLFKAAEERIDNKIAELQNLRVTIDSLIKKFDAQQDAKLNSLVKIYENMKPKSAARIFEQLEMDTLLEVAERMKERKLAAIMAQLGEERAREVTVELRRLREMPKVGVDPRDPSDGWEGFRDEWVVPNLDGVIRAHVRLDMGRSRCGGTCERPCIAGR